MPKDTTKNQNPLLSKNIPSPPSTTTTREESISEPEKVTTAKEQKGRTVKRDNGFSYPDQAEEKATIEVSLYLRPSQDDKLEDLKREYKRRTRKKISSNQIMRLLIEKATLDDLL